MKRYLFDTAPLAAYLLGRPAAQRLIAPWIQQDEAITSILAHGEVTEYLKGMSNYLLLDGQFRRLLRAVYPAALTFRIMARYADLRRAMRAPHGPGLIGDVDTLIAATALERNLTLVMTDGDFLRVPDLHVMTISLKS